MKILGFAIGVAVGWWIFWRWVPRWKTAWDFRQGAKICAQHGHTWQRAFRVRSDLDPHKKYSAAEALEFLDIVTEGKAAFCMRCCTPMPDKTRVEIHKLQAKARALLNEN